MHKFSRGLTALYLAATIPLLTACASAGAVAKTGSPMKLTEQQTVTVAPGAMLTYDSVADSRCPPDVQCVVAGKVVYSFTLKKGDASESFSLSPAAPEYVSPALGQRIVLAEPAAAPEAKAAGGQHPVTVQLLPK